MRRPIRSTPLNLLDSGDLLFFRAQIPVKKSIIETFGRLFTRGTLGSSYGHVSAVYRDINGLFGPQNMLYSFEYCIKEGGPVLFPLHKRAHRSLNNLICRELAEPKPQIDRKSLDDFILEATEMTRQGKSPHGIARWAQSSLQRHVLFLCPDPRKGGTCADYVIRFLEAAGLWKAEHSSFCTSVTELLYENDIVGFPKYTQAENVKSIRGVSPKKRRRTEKSSYDIKFPCRKTRSEHSSILNPEVSL